MGMSESFNWPAAISTSLVVGAKPLAVTATVYLPGARFLTSYAPAPSDVAVTRPARWNFLRVMLAPGITAPVASTICPRSRPGGLRKQHSRNKPA